MGSSASSTTQTTSKTYTTNVEVLDSYNTFFNPTNAFNKNVNIQSGDAAMESPFFAGEFESEIKGYTPALLIGALIIVAFMFFKSRKG